MATITENEPGTSVRDALDAAFEQHATDEVQEPAPAPPPVASPPPPPPPEGTDEGQQAAAAADAAQRDARGRFAPKPGQEGAQQQAAAAPVQGQAGAPAELKAPASWSPATREKWAGLDPEVKAEVHRREVEQNRVLEQGAQARQFIQAFENVVRPFEVFIRSENSNPLQAVQNLMQTAAEFRVGTPQRKVQLVAGLIRDFGIDIEQLDSTLAGHVSGQQAQGAAPQQFRDPRFDQFLAQRQAEQQAQQQQAQQAVQQELQAFAASHEFYRDVEGTMADLLAHAARRGEALDLEKAYTRACQLDAGISTILTQRSASAPKGTQSAAVLRAKRAAASVKGDTTHEGGATVPKDDSVRSAIEAAMQTHSEA